jgi:hypothetical protein
MILETQKSFQPAKKDVKYLNKDFSQLKQSLVDFAKVYYPNTYKDFSEASVGMMFIEMSAYVGDVLSYYVDYQFKESMLVNSEERQNIVDSARSLGYRVKISTPSVTSLDVYQLVPAKTDENGEIVPDLVYAQIIKPGMTALSDNGVSFITNFAVDFTVDTKNDPLEISVYQRNLSGQPEFYVLKKTVAAAAGQIATKTISVSDPTSFYRVELAETNVIGIMDIYDSDGNRWYETEYLAQDMVPIDSENIFKNDMVMSAYRDTAPFLIKFLRTSRRFVTGTNADDTTFIEFGAGTNVKDDEIIIPNVNTVSNQSLFRTENVSYDPANFLSSKSYGQAPANTTLTIRYVTGGGVASNVNANSITNVTSVEFFGDITELPNLEQNLTSTVRRSIKVNNPVPAVGGMGSESNDSIRTNALANHSAQNRAVTQQDYIIRSYAMPSKYGSIAKAYAIADQSIDTSKKNYNPFAVNLYILCYNSQKKLIISNLAIQENLKNYLNQYRMLTDSVNIIDGYIINIGVDFGIIVYKNYNKRDVLTNCLTKVQEYFDIDNAQFCQPINLSRLELEISRVDGVQSVNYLKLKNLTLRNGDYSQYEYDIQSATVDKIIYPSLDPSVFEVKYPTKDIVGKVL